MWNNAIGKFLFALVLIGAFVAMLWFSSVNGASMLPERAYSDFVIDLRASKVDRVDVRDRYLVATYKTGGERQSVGLPGDDAQLVNLMVASGVTVEYGQGEGDWTGSIWLFVGLAVLFGGLLWFARQSANGARQLSSFGQTQAQVHSPGPRTVTMNDVAGMPEVKEELAEVVDFLRSPDRYLELGARIPKGILLYGPPGTGKTLLARAVAGEAGVSFFAASGSEFVEMFAGVGASRVRDLFAKARQEAPCIIFVDEIDAVGRQRGVSISGGSDERDQTLNQLLVEMDGFGPNEGIVVMAATNRIDILDPAVIRPGRFDRHIPLDPPDRVGRREILAVHAMGKRLAADVDLDRVASLTLGFTGADLANLLNEAALLTARRRLSAITTAELTRAYERIVTGGPPSQRRVTEEERTRVAYHEAGHAVISRQLEHADLIDKVTIVPRGHAMGYVLYRPQSEKYLQSRSELLDRMVSMLGGRAAEEVVFGEVTTGAADDLEQATLLARRMVTELGMCDQFGPVALSRGELPAAPISQRTAAAVDEAVGRLIRKGYERAVELANVHRRALDVVAEALLERESVEGEELDQILAAGKLVDYLTVHPL